MFVPYLELKYRERTRAAVDGEDGMRYTKVDVEIEYSMSNQRFWKVAKGFIYFFLAAVGLVCLHACRHWQRRNYAVDSADMPTGGFTFAYLLNICLLLGRLFVHVFFPVVFAM